MNHYKEQFIVSMLFTGISTLILGIFVYLRDRKNKINVTFALYSFSISWWSLAQIGNVAGSTLDISLFWARVEQMGVVFIPTFFLHFIAVFLGLKIKNKIRLCYILSFIFAFLSPTTNLICPRAEKKFGLINFGEPGFLYPLLILFFIGVIIYTFSLLLTAYSKSTGIRRIQLKYLTWPSLVGYLGGATNFLLVYDINIYPLNPYGTYFVGIYTFAVAYAIARHRLMDISLAITRTGIFVAVYTFVLGLPFALAVGMKSWLIELFDAQWWVAPLGLMALLATIGPFIYIYVERKAEERLLKEQKRYQQTLKQASVGMTRIRDLKKLLNLITHIVTKTVRISHAAVYLYNRDSDEYVLEASRDSHRFFIPKLSPDTPLIKHLAIEREPLVYEELAQRDDSAGLLYKELEEGMRDLSAAVVIPSFLEDKFMGFIVLGDKLSGQIYTPDDLNVFQVLATQAALAIENAQFYEETKEMQQQISQAEKMATIGTMADGLSHQINNRFHALSLIAGDTIDTIKITDTTKCSPEVRQMLEQVNYALGRIQSNVIQGGKVVEGLLKYSRKGEEKFEILDLNQVLDNTLEMVQYKVKLSEIDFIRNFNNHIPKIKGNLTQLEEVFFNFIDNAYDAIQERKTTLNEPGFRGKITVSAQPNYDDTLQVIIEDNGMGIKDESAKKIFAPFFTTKTSSRKGTGLGLYVVHRIITDAHKGKIAFESTYKSGTKFILELPTVKK